MLAPIDRSAVKCTKTILRLSCPAIVGLLIIASSFAEPLYFPVRENDSAPGVSQFEAEWYSRSLTLMHEPRLPEATEDSTLTIYRFTLLPTWGNPVVVRVQRDSANYHLYLSRTDGQAGYYEGKLVEQKDIELSDVDSKILDSLVTRLSLLNMPSDEEILGFDGEQWILEGVKDGRYHVVVRWTVTYDTKERDLGPFLTLCRYLIDMSPLSETPKNKGHEIFPRNNKPTGR